MRFVLVATQCKRLLFPILIRWTKAEEISLLSPLAVTTSPSFSSDPNFSNAFDSDLDNEWQAGSTAGGEWIEMALVTNNLAVTVYMVQIDYSAPAADVAVYIGTEEYTPETIPGSAKSLCYEGPSEGAISCDGTFDRGNFVLIANKNADANFHFAEVLLYDK